MKKITNFIVDKRNYILILMIILSTISLVISKKVVINKDITKYLPNASETRIGMDIMEENFEELEQSDLYIMFKNLSKDEKESIKKDLEKEKYVSSVEYDDTRKFNNKEYTLYILNTDEYSNSKNAKNLYKNIKEEYKDKNIILGGSIDYANKPVVKEWILISAVLFAMIILIIMCESYIEPFLFLFTIGLAIFLNNGTNIMFDSISNITSAISAVLQLALSMDYSIILMNRYTQEKQKRKDNKEAMKEALFNAFKSITSSSLTTIVGLLALVFMTFTIGKDLGFVLAKGVFFSLLTIFTCLPALILLFDKAIEKTKKKHLTLKLNTIGNFEYKYRYPILIIFIILFISSFILRGNLTYLYTGAEQDEIAKHFKTNNQMAIIYNNEYEEQVGSYCKNINNPNVDEVLCYKNTIGYDVKYNELNNKLEELNQESDIDEYLVKIVYYYYNNKNINNTITFQEFINFIENTIYNNENINSKIDNNMKNDIERLKNFTEPYNINSNKNYNEMSNILGIDSYKLKNLYILEHKNNVNINLTAEEFINFLINDVIPNNEYNKNIDTNTINSINELKIFTNKNLINTNLNKNNLHNLYNIDEEQINNILTLYYSTHDSGFKISLTEFLLGLDNLRSYINIDMTSLDRLILLTKNENNINNTPLNKEYLKQYFTGNEQLVELVYSTIPENTLISPKDFINLVLENYTPYLQEEDINTLKLVKLVLDDSKYQYSYKELSYILNIDENKMLSIYSLLGNLYNYEYTLSPYEFTDFLITNNLVTDNNTLYKLNILMNVMNSTNNNIRYNYQEISNILSIDKNTTSLLYSLYDINYLNNNYGITTNNFVKFILNNVINDSVYKNNFDESAINKLNTLNKVMDYSLNNTYLTNNELFNILKSLGNLEKETVDLVYIYYGSINNYNEEYTLTIEEFINYLNSDIINNEIFKEYIDNDLKNKIIDAKKTINDSKKLLVSEKYSRVIINTTFDKENSDTFKFIDKIKEDLKTENKEIYLIGDSPMAHSLNSSFSNELNYITILTMIAIFLVVALTFKSIIVPLILVLIIECSVFSTMSILSFSGKGIYFIAILIVQSILMGATIDYAIVYTSYYKENRLKNKSINESIINAYNDSIHTILTSASILIIVTFIVGLFAEAIAAKICITISQGTLCSSILILFLLPGMLASIDKFIIKDKKKKN